MKKIFLPLLIMLVTAPLIAEEFLIINFDDEVKLGSFQWTDEKGSRLSRGSAFKDPNLGCHMGIKFDVVDGGWAGWGLGLDGLNASAYKYLSFAVKGEEGMEDFEVGFKDKSNVERKIKVSGHTEVQTDWQTVKIPLTSYEGINFNSLDAVLIAFGGFSGKGRIFIDNIKLITGTSDGQDDVAVSAIKRSNKVLIDGFERTSQSDMYYVFEGDDSTLKLLSSRIVKEGDYSMELEYNLSTNKAWGTWVAARARTRVASLNWAGTKMIKIWVYGDGSDNVLRFSIIDKDGEMWSYDEPEALRSTKWVMVSMPINKFYRSKESLEKNGRLDIDDIRTYELSVVSKSGIGTSGTRSVASKIYVDQLYLVGEEISSVGAVPKGIVERLRVAVPSIGNIDFSGVVWTEYFYSPEEKSRIFHWAKLASDAMVDKYSVRLELNAIDQNFEDAAYYVYNSSDTYIGTRSMGMQAVNLSVTANEPAPNITNISAGNIWVDYSPYTFAPVWGYKGFTMEGDYDRINYHAFLIKGKFSSFSGGTRLKTYLPWKVQSTGIIIYSQDYARQNATSRENTSGILENSTVWLVEEAARDISYTFEIRKRFSGEKYILTGTYGKNMYSKFIEVDFTDPLDPKYNTTLDAPEQYSGEMRRGRLEINNFIFKGLYLSNEYRDMDIEFKPKYRQGPFWFDDNDADQKGVNLRLNQWYKGFVFSWEGDYLKRIDYADGYRNRNNYGVGFYGFEGLDVSINREEKIDVNNTRSSRSNFSAVNRGDEIYTNEFYLRSQLRGDLVLWFKIWMQDSNENITDHLFTKLEHYLSSNAKLFAEFKVTRYPFSSWEPRTWPYDDNYAKIYFELTY